MPPRTRPNLLEHMRPLPTSTQVTPVAAKPTAPVATQTLELGPLHHSSPSAQNRRASSGGGVQRSYPWLLLASTGLAAVFCGLYLTKPVIAAGTPPQALAQDSSFEPAPPPPPGPAPARSAGAPLLPDSSALPGDGRAKPQAADPRVLKSAETGPAASYEETNLRIQHVLKAQGPDGEDLGKIMLEVPVLYGSRSLRWTPEEIARARDLLVRIGDYQEKTRALQAEGAALLSEWNGLVEDSVPTEVLRADSPSLTRDALLNPAEGLDSSEAIEIQSR